MNKKDIKLIKERIKECKDDIYFFKIFNDDEDWSLVNDRDQIDEIEVQKND